MLILIKKNYSITNNKSVTHNNKLWYYINEYLITENLEKVKIKTYLVRIYLIVIFNLIQVDFNFLM